VAGSDNSHGHRLILGLAATATTVYLALALAGDLRERPALYLIAFAALSGVMLVGWRAVRAHRRLLPWAIGAALVFRLAACFGAPMMSDDVYRYVWDGRVQLQGVHPYRHAPIDAELAPLRDDPWKSINHPEVETIYPPLAQAFFLCLAALGAGPVSFKLALGLVDFGVVLALDHFLRRRSLPRDRLILYAWNPLAVLETSGSGHVEPIGVLLVVLAGAWIIDRRQGLSTMALAASVHVKLLSAMLLPVFTRRLGGRWALWLPVALVLPLLPYALTGPAVGGGLFEYAERWEHNATFYAVTEAGLEGVGIGERLTAVLAWLSPRLDGWPVAWDFLYRHVWPRDVARLLVAVAAACWAIGIALRRDLPFARQILLVLGGVLLLSPTLHPWYLLWILPWAAALASPAWLLLGFTVVLAYANPGGEVPAGIRIVEFGLPLALGCYHAARSGRTR